MCVINASSFTVNFDNELEHLLYSTHLFFQVFNKNVWLAVVCLPLIPTIVLWLFERFFIYLSIDDKKDAFEDMLFQCYGVIMFQGDRIRLSVRLSP